MYNGVIVESLIREDIINAVSAYEPRVIMTNNDIVIVRDNTAIQIYIQYKIKETGEVNSFNMDITLNDNPYR